MWELFYFTRHMAANQLLDHLLSSTGASIDSRTIQPGQLFFSLPGSRTDGSQFAGAALDAGALLAIVPRDSGLGEEDHRYWVVDDVLTTMQVLARDYRRHLQIPVLAITGSNGKTTNKNLLAAAISCRYRVHYTAGNFNNHIGLPLTILNAPADTEFLLLEMGTNHFGEIRDLCAIAEPNYGSILNVGKSHLEFLQSVEGVLRAKSELADFLAARDGLLFVNREEESLQPLLDHPVEKVLFDRHHIPNGDFEVEIRQTVPGIVLDIRSRAGSETYTLVSPLWGSHNVRNLVHTLGVASWFSVEMADMIPVLAAYSPLNNRSQIITWKGHQVYLDAYNANPTSMSHAIRGFHAANSGQGILVLGDMGELGEVAAQEHRAILQLVDRLKFEHVYLVGEEFEKVGRKRFPRFQYVDDVLDLNVADWSGDEPILIKGSRYMALERLVNEG